MTSSIILGVKKRKLWLISLALTKTLHLSPFWFFKMPAALVGKRWNMCCHKASQADVDPEGRVAPQRNGARFYITSYLLIFEKRCLVTKWGTKAGRIFTPDNIHFFCLLVHYDILKAGYKNCMLGWSKQPHEASHVTNINFLPASPSSKSPKKLMAY